MNVNRLITRLEALDDEFDDIAEEIPNLPASKNSQVKILKARLKLKEAVGALLIEEAQRREIEKRKRK